MKMREKFTRQLARLARHADLDSLIKWSEQSTVFPFYHAVSEEPLPHISHLYRVRTTAEFEGDLELLLKYFEPMGLAVYLDQAGEKRGKRGMVLTFDDGLKECHHIIAPLLKKKGIPAVFFLNNQVYR